MGLTFDSWTYLHPLTSTENQHVVANEDQQLHMGGGGGGWKQQRALFQLGGWRETHPTPSDQRTEERMKGEREHVGK